MLRNYITIALRNIRKYRMFSFINIFGLALAMSVCLLIILMLADQNRYEQFNTRKDRIYRILTHAPNGRQPYATTSYPLGSYLKANYPIVEDAATLLPGVSGDVQYRQKVTQMKGYFTDPSFFKIFDFTLEQGDKGSALRDARSIVITTSLAQYLFRGDDPIGKTVQFSDRNLPFPIESDDETGKPPVDWGSFTITGVIDASKYKSHLRFDVLMSASTISILQSEMKMEDLSNNWDWYFRPYNYVMLHDGKSVADLNEALADVVKLQASNIQAEYSKGLTFEAQSLTDVQLGLYSNDTNNRMPIQGYYLLGILAVIIMISACLNYTNLSIARALTRAKEIGIRKVAGANKRSLVAQFVGESIVVSLCALAMALAILALLRPAFTSLWLNKYLEFELTADPSILIAFVAFALFIGIIAGTYPAFRLSAYKPVDALKKQESSRTSAWGLRKVLSVSQFCVSLVFITTSILIFNQFKHYMSFDYGMATENIINVSLQGQDYRKVANELSQVHGVVNISAADLIPGAGRTNGASIRKPGENDYTQAWVINADENFIDNLGLTLLDGNIIPTTSDSTGVDVIVNEDLVRKLGYERIVGEFIESKYDKQPLRVVGVVKDFRYKLLINSQEIGPLLIFNRASGPFFDRPSTFSYLNVKVATNDLPALIGTLEAKWKTVDPIHEFKYQFFDEQLAGTHQAIMDIVSILGFISFLAIVIACLGLLGMATYMTERRKKEVGIRKVLGAADWGIIVLLSKTFLKVLGVAVLIGAPMSYFVNNLWLEFLPNRVEFGVGTIVIATLVLLILGLITVGSQTMKASQVKPVDTLKEE
ncbi:MAG TPA: ABC transporter permease [Cyclobacteriaceae bacterium]|nr:ABC transporter permease [Cyclobacteriaceae bacterium]